MGGYGSGRHASHNTVEECRVLTVADLDLDANKGTETSITARWGAGHWQILRAVIAPTRRGRRRWWLVCGGCGRHILKVYLPPGTGRFACRTCWRLSYASCRDSHHFDNLYRLIAADTGMMFRDVKAALESGYSKRTVRMLNAALSGGRDLAHLHDRKEKT